MAGVLEGRRIVVTGAATGIGAAVVAACAGEGAELAAVYRQSAPPSALADAARWWQCDLRDHAAVDALFTEVVSTLGSLDVLVHCAGAWAPAAPESVTSDELDDMLAANLKATVFTNQAAFRHLRARGGAIVNMGSSEGVFGSPISVGYAVAKGGVHTWTRAAARAWGPHGVTVNAVSPVMDTPGMDRYREFVGPEVAATMADSVAAAVPLGRIGDPVSDLGPVVVFLASPAAHFVTGQLIPVDGGALMVGA